MIISSEKVVMRIMCGNRLSLPDILRYTFYLEQTLSLNHTVSNRLCLLTSYSDSTIPLVHWRVGYFPLQNNQGPSHDFKPQPEWMVLCWSDHEAWRTNLEKLEKISFQKRKTVCFTKQYRSIKHRWRELRFPVSAQRSPEVIWSPVLPIYSLPAKAGLVFSILHITRKAPSRYPTYICSLTIPWE